MKEGSKFCCSGFPFCRCPLPPIPAEMAEILRQPPKPLKILIPHVKIERENDGDPEVEE